MEPIKIKPRILKSVQKQNETVTMADGNVYVPLKIDGEKEAMRACLHMILKHTADMFVTICEIVADEYKLDSEKMVKTIQASPRYENLCADDVLLTLGYLDAHQVAPKVEEPKVEDPKVEEPKVEEPKPKQKRKPRAPKVAEPKAPEEPKVAEPKAPEPKVAEEQPKKVKVRIVKKAANE
jgi:hypothetical protein